MISSCFLKMILTFTYIQDKAQLVLLRIKIFLYYNVFSKVSRNGPDDLRRKVVRMIFCICWTKVVFLLSAVSVLRGDAFNSSINLMYERLDAKKNVYFFTLLYLRFAKKQKHAFSRKYSPIYYLCYLGDL